MMLWEKKFLLTLVAAVLFGLTSVLADGRISPVTVSYGDVEAEFATLDALDTTDFSDFDDFQRYLQTTETTRCNFWCMLKNSLGLTIVGLLLICLSPCLMWKNEGRHVTELRRIDFCKNKAVVVENSDIPTDENTGQLVHFVGTVSVGDTSLELTPGTALNVSAPMSKALVIKRTCMIYQKFEDASNEVKQDRLGGGQTTTTTFTCREDWTPMGPQPERLQHLTDETNSRGIWDDLIAAAGGEGDGATAAPAPALPPNMPPQMAAMLQKVDPSKAPNDIAVSPAAHVGGFGLSKDIVMEEAGVFQAEWTPLPADLVPDTVDGCEGLVKRSDGTLSTCAEDGQPQNGDVMIKYEYTTDGFDCSFVVEQIMAAESDPEVGAKYGVSKADVIDDKCCGKIHDNLGVIWMVRRGRHDLADMINMAKQDEKQLTKLLRIVCWVLLVAGWIMLFSIFTTVLSTLPILGKLGYFAVVIIALIIGSVCCLGVTALAYMRYRPAISIAILAIGLGIWGVVGWAVGSAAVNSVQPTFAPTPAPRFTSF